MGFHLIQTFFWVALSTWFGGVLFIAVAAPIIFRTVRESNPLLPTVLSVNMEGQHGTLLAGSIVGNLLNNLVRVELACAGVLVLAIVGQWFLLPHDQSGAMIRDGVRTALFVGAAGMVVYEWRVVWPRVQKYRNEYIEHADDPDVANPAKDQFDRYHRESVTILSIRLFLLMGLIFLSSGLSPSATFRFSSEGAGRTPPGDVEAHGRP